MGRNSLGSGMIYTRKAMKQKYKLIDRFQYSHCIRKGDVFIVAYRGCRVLNDETWNMLVERLESRLLSDVEGLNLKNS